MQGVGCRVQDTGCRMQDVGCRMQNGVWNIEHIRRRIRMED